MRLLCSATLLVMCVACAPSSSGSGALSSDPTPTETATVASSRASPGAQPVSPTSVPSPKGVRNLAVTRRATGALAGVGAQEVITPPGYEDQVNTSVTGRWRGLPFQAFVVPASERVSSELAVVSRQTIEGQEVEVMRVEDGSVRFLSFTLGTDRWLVASLTPSRAQTDISTSVALVAELSR